MAKSSKRETFKQKYKVQRKVRDHKKKIKKLAKENPHLLRKKGVKEDPGIPNLWPFKQAMLRDAEESKIEEMQRLANEKEKRKKDKERQKNKWEVEEKQRLDEFKDLHTKDGKRNWYFKELRKVIETCDVILEVVDARDPIGCRAHDIERMILAQQGTDGAPTKKIVIVLNKIDLVPSDVVQDWVKYLRREFPTVAFKSSTQKHRGFISSLDVKTSKASAKALDSKSAVGSSALLQLLKNYSRSLDIKKGLTVGVIGYPNVGKSSIINSLKMQRAVQVSPAAGCTKVLQQVRLDGNIMLVDSPGVLFSADNEDNHGGLLLRNALRPDQVADPIAAMQGILERCTKEQLMSIYQIAEFKTTQEFLLFVGHRRGKLGKGGVPNLEDAARSVLQDWNAGKIPFYTIPPTVTDQHNTIVSQFAEAFDIQALLDEANSNTVRVIREHGLGLENQVLGGADDDDEDDDDDGMEFSTSMYSASVVDAPSISNSGLMTVEESGSESEDNDGMVDDDDNEEDEEEMAELMARAVQKQHNKKQSSAPVKQRMGRAKAASVLSNSDYDMPKTASLKATQKKAKKALKKSTSSMSNDDYNFDEDWN